MSSIAVQSLPHTPSFSSSSSPLLTFPPASAITMETRPRMDSLKVREATFSITGSHFATYSD